MDRHLGSAGLGHERRRIGKPPRRPAEGDGGNLLDTGKRDGDERQEQDPTKPERKGGAGHEIVALPESNDRSAPGADQIGGRRKRQRLRGRHPGYGQDRQRQQQSQEDREAGSLDVVRVGNGTGPGKLRFTRGIEQTPVRSDAAFEGFPGLIDRLDDVVVDAVGLGARDEVAQHDRLLDAAGIGVVEIVAGARPAEFGDHDPLAGVHPAQLVVELDGVVDRIGGVEPLPIGQDMRGNEIDGRGELRMIDPDRPDFTGRHGDWA